MQPITEVPLTYADHVVQLDNLLDAKHAQAKQLGVTRTYVGSNSRDNHESHSVDSFVLTSAAGGVHVHRGKTTRLFINTLHGAATIDTDYPCIDIKTGVAIGSSKIQNLIRLINPMAIAPPVHVPYGVITGGVWIGAVIFTVPFCHPGQPGLRREQLGLVNNTYVIEGRGGTQMLRPAWMAMKGPKDFTTWYSRFWAAASRHEVVPLTGYFDQITNADWRVNNGGHPNFELFVEGLCPLKFITGRRYVRWDASEKYPGEHLPETLTGPLFPDDLRSWSHSEHHPGAY